MTPGPFQGSGPARPERHLRVAVDVQELGLADVAIAPGVARADSRNVEGDCDVGLGDGRGEGRGEENVAAAERPRALPAGEAKQVPCPEGRPTRAPDRAGTGRR